MTHTLETVQFVKESNNIEGIHRDPTEEELDQFDLFTERADVTVDNLVEFVSIYQPDAKLRDTVGDNVTVGRHRPMPGGPDVKDALQNLLDDMANLTPFQAHAAYELLHPFTDGNGRSGRALWYWHMVDSGKFVTLSFLHHYYYQALDNARVAGNAVGTAELMLQRDEAHNKQITELVDQLVESGKVKKC